MTNEELTTRIQAGENRYEELWLRVKGFIYKQAFSYSRFFPDSTLELDDLAQAGYLALCAAVKKFDPDAGGSFLYLLKLNLRRIWREMYGLRGKKEPLDDALSLDEPVDDDGEIPRGDTISDPKAAAAFEDKGEALFRDELREYLEKALDAAPHGDIMRRRYFQGQTGPEIAVDLGVSPSCVYQYEMAAKSYLRRGPFTRGLRSFDFYHGAGLQSWKDTGTSIEEKYLLLRER